MKEKCIFIQISWKIVPKGLIDDMSALVQVIAWRRTGNKPLPEPMMAPLTCRYATLGGNEFKLNEAWLHIYMMHFIYIYIHIYVYLIIWSS